MKDYTPHHIVDAYKCDLDRSSLSDVYIYWRNVPPYKKTDEDFRSFVLVHEIEPTTLLVKYKAGTAYRSAKTYSHYVNFPYQFLFWKIVSYKNINNNQWATSAIAPEILFSPISWSDESPDLDTLYRPWLPNALGINLGSYFCSNANSAYFTRSIHERMRGEPTIEALLATNFLKKMVSYYDNFLEEPFNADAGGVKLKNYHSSNAIVTPFKKIQKVSFDELLDPSSDWYTQQAVAWKETKSYVKKVYLETSV